MTPAGQIPGRVSHVTGRRPAGPPGRVRAAAAQNFTPTGTFLFAHGGSERVVLEL